MFSKKTLILIIFLSLVSLAFAGFVLAQVIPNPLSANSIEELIDSLINAIFWLAVVIVPLIIIIGAIYYIISGGSPEKIKTAKNIILYAVIGFAIVLLAKGLISMIKSIIGG